MNNKKFGILSICILMYLCGILVGIGTSVNKLQPSKNQYGCCTCEVEILKKKIITNKWTTWTDCETAANHYDGQLGCTFNMKSITTKEGCQK